MVWKTDALALRGLQGHKGASGRLPGGGARAHMSGHQAVPKGHAPNCVGDSLSTKVATGKAGVKQLWEFGKVAFQLLH